jgi:hypothetical protein
VLVLPLYVIVKVTKVSTCPRYAVSAMRLHNRTRPRPEDVRSTHRLPMRSRRAGRYRADTVACCGSQWQPACIPRGGWRTVLP